MRDGKWCKWVELKAEIIPANTAVLALPRLAQGQCIQFEELA